MLDPEKEIVVTNHVAMRYQTRIDKTINPDDTEEHIRSLVRDALREGRVSRMRPKQFRSRMQTRREALLGDNRRLVWTPDRDMAFLISLNRTSHAVLTVFLPRP